MNEKELKIKCLEAIKFCTTVTDFSEYIGYRKGGLHKRTFERLNKLCGVDLKEQIVRNKELSKLKRTTCLFCGKSFSKKYSKYSNGKFCSKECARRYSSKYANTEEVREVKRKASRSYYEKHPEYLDRVRNTEKAKEGYKKYMAKKYPKVEWICPVCNKRLLLTEYKASIRKYCSRECRNVATNKFKNGSISKAEKELRKVINKNFPEIEVKYNDRILLGGLELDVYIPSLKYAVEWNGIFHFIDINGKLDRVQEKDRLKQNLCKSKEIYLRVVKDLKSDKKSIDAGTKIVLEDIARLVQQ